MTLDYKKLAEEKRGDILADLKTLVAIDSSRDLANKTDEYPLGPGPAKALAAFLGLAERDGFKNVNIDNLAGRVEFGQGDKILGVIGHMDEVPAGDGWVTDPFEVVAKDGNLYGRGTADDKGPSLAAYYALKILKEQGVKLNKQVHFIVGTDEENDWTGINRYLETEPHPDFVFSPDAEYPIINGEKGIVTFALDFKGVANTGATKLLSFQSGLASNMVPQTATVTISGSSLDTMKADYDKYLADKTLTGTFEVNGLEAKVILNGQGAHGSEPSLGRNAATFLGTFLSNYDFAGRDLNYLKTIASFLHEDFDGSKLGINHHDDLMGELSAAPDVYDYSADSARILVNVRYPQGITVEEINEIITDKLGEILTSAVFGHNQTPHYVSGDDELVKTLLAVYERQTGKKGHEQIIGGGTYGRIFERGVAFGAQPEDAPMVMHQPNEYMSEQAIIDSIAIYAESIYELTK